MRVTRLKRILLIVISVFVLLLASLFYLGPVGMSFYTARIAVPVTRVVPVDLRDRTISQASGSQLSYLGYEFEVPWADLDSSKTQLYPKDNPTKTMVVISFRSGLRIMITSHNPGESVEVWTSEFKIPPRNLEAIFGPGSAKSDYILMKNAFSFTPDKMHHWNLTPALYAREQVLYLAKSLMPSAPARSGIFNVGTDRYHGFQQGNPETERSGVIVTLFDSDGGVEFVFDAKHYDNPGITQPEINRIVQSLHKITPGDSVAQR
jgi:hypothetical protein